MCLEQSKNKNYGRVMEEESWRRSHGGGVMDEESWKRNHRGVMEEESWRRDHGEGLMEEESWRWRNHRGGVVRRNHVGVIGKEASSLSHLGDIWEPSGNIWEASGSHLEGIWGHLGGIWEASGRPGLPRRSPGNLRGWSHVN